MNVNFEEWVYIHINYHLFQGDEDANLAPQMSEGGFQFNPSGGPGDAGSSGSAPTNIEF